MAIAARSTIGDYRFNALMLLYVHKGIELNIYASLTATVYCRKYPRSRVAVIYHATKSLYHETRFNSRNKTCMDVNKDI